MFSMHRLKVHMIGFLFLRKTNLRSKKIYILKNIIKKFGQCNKSMILQTKDVISRESLGFCLLILVLLLSVCYSSKSNAQRGSQDQQAPE